jgi:hypothetical protein
VAWGGLCLLARAQPAPAPALTYALPSREVRPPLSDQHISQNFTHVLASSQGPASLSSVRLRCGFALMIIGPPEVLLSCPPPVSSLAGRSPFQAGSFPMQCRPFPWTTHGLELFIAGGAHSCALLVSDLLSPLVPHFPSSFPYLSVLKTVLNSRSTVFVSMYRYSNLQLTSPCSAHYLVVLHRTCGLS